MGCGSCSTGGCSTQGCKSGGCATGGCNKLNTYDWFSGVAMPGTPETEAIYEIRFKNTHKDFFRNVNGLSLITGDMVAVESDRGFNVGQVSLSGVLAKLQMRKKKVKDNPDRIRKIYRKATEDDLNKLQTARSREYSTLVRSRQIVQELDLNMKISDVEFQGDNTKAIFYYIADHRVDFRQLIRVLADEFRIRVEMRQIGLRYEAALVGGIGSCGRELCCSTWLSDFKSVPTSAARYQNIALNPMKISGMCGRLKCCLNYELETYLDALEGIPEVNRIDTQMGPGFLQKTDIFKGIMWFSYQNEATWIPVTAANVKKMMDMNRKGERPESLRYGEDLSAIAQNKEPDFVDVVGQAKLRPEKRGNANRKKKKGPPRNEGQRQGQPGDGRVNQNPQEQQQGGQDQQPRNQQGNRQQGRNDRRGSDNRRNPNTNRNQQGPRPPKGNTPPPNEKPAG